MNSSIAPSSPDRRGPGTEYPRRRPPGASGSALSAPGSRRPSFEHLVGGRPFPSSSVTIRSGGGAATSVSWVLRSPARKRKPLVQRIDQVQHARIPCLSRVARSARRRAAASGCWARARPRDRHPLRLTARQLRRARGVELRAQGRPVRAARAGPRFVVGRQGDMLSERHVSRTRVKRRQAGFAPLEYCRQTDPPRRRTPRAPLRRAMTAVSPPSIYVSPSRRDQASEVHGAGVVLPDPERPQRPDSLGSADRQFDFAEARLRQQRLDHGTTVTESADRERGFSRPWRSRHHFPVAHLDERGRLPRATRGRSASRRRTVLPERGPELYQGVEYKGRSLGGVEARRVGSSASTSCERRAAAPRLIATRCCSPPESEAGRAGLRVARGRMRFRASVAAEAGPVQTGEGASEIITFLRAREKVGPQVLSRLED